MNEKQFHELVALLKERGWKEQEGGYIYINGTIATNLIKDDELLHVSLDDWPDEEVVEELFGKRAA